MKYAFLYSALMIFLAISCQEEPMVRFGFDTDFNNNSHGFTFINITEINSLISLKGKILLTEGEIDVEVINPSGESIFNCHLKSPVHANIDEPLPAACGSWKLKYKSLNGAGKLTLHIYIDF